MATVERIQELLNCSVSIPVKDDAGIIIPAGVDAAVRTKALQECLKIVENELRKENNGI